jgi:hypothetical protein
LCGHDRHGPPGSAGAGAVASLPFAARAHADKAAIAANEGCLDFVDCGGATIFSEQIPKDDWKEFYVIDARDKNPFARERIPAA